MHGASYAMTRNTLIIGLLAVACRSWGQPTITPRLDVKITPVIKEVRYCFGLISRLKYPDSPGRSDTTLFLRYGLRYENRLRKPIVVPVHNDTFIRVKVLGAPEVHVLSVPASYFPDELAAITVPEPKHFTTIPAMGSSDENLGGQFWLRLTSPTEVLLGKTVEIAILQDHRATWGAVPYDNWRKWDKYGMPWEKAAESEVLRIEIPTSPKTVDCIGSLGVEGDGLK
jgi:hypothetical protein